MVNTLKIYLETSVWNFALPHASLEKHEITKELFKEIRQGKYDIYISDFVIGEISDAKAIRKSELEELIHNHKPRNLDIPIDLQALVTQYKKRNIIPEKYETDLHHIAIAVIHGMDILLSWNMRHIVKYKTKHAVNEVNEVIGYRHIEILTPEEVIEYD